ncbi:dTDP-4-dehydrorhamnose reductase [compost metagenome]
MRVLVLGASGMLGSAVMRVLSEKKDWEIFGTVRSGSVAHHFSPQIADGLLPGCDVENHDALVSVFNKVKPAVVINCIGLVKQLADAGNPLLALPINSLLPHRLAGLCELSGARLIHISTDCVFNGDRGAYVEDDVSDATDLYGKSKYLGEVYFPHTVTLRTSIIGHELQNPHGLVEWFLEQKDRCHGYTRSVFSGLPTVVLAQFIRDIVIPKADLHGLYHVAAQPISKFDLLALIAEIYGKEIDIVPDDSVVVDRSLTAEKLTQDTGYIAPDWRNLIQLMHLYK